MANEFDSDKAKEVLENGISQAQDLMKDPSAINDLLAEAQEKIRDIPLVGEDIANIPAVFGMIKGYVTREYTDVSPKVIASLVSALVYLIKNKDLIPDNIPLLGQVDDVAVITAALKVIAPEVEAFKQWQENKA